VPSDNYLNFKIIKLVMVWMQRFEICDFVCKKVCIKWECASSGDLRYPEHFNHIKSAQNAERKLPLRQD
jgi:hypothetical protein